MSAASEGADTLWLAVMELFMGNRPITSEQIGFQGSKHLLLPQCIKATGRRALAFLCVAHDGRTDPKRGGKQDVVVATSK